MDVASFAASIANPALHIFFIVGVLGSILLMYSQFVEAENRRDLIRMVGAAALAVYAISIGNILFIITTTGIFFAALIEFVEIYLGIHTHFPAEMKTMIQTYKKGEKK
ncbi:MAG TPA: hypothetical protein DCY48_04510 [Candidatus Magasanikbacteria bacterium]|nr:MAG: hypothetical protein A3I74_03040 [Candidatus Magasanikbacteria bacterium RIFCSPLOWO2_02_FULL_47_16]OGH79535.1 MAG: hypothetical protein A3C10_00365 [Candidatus Magasanikbacteria bacterium RIFCSPHIGHO2_02_FULL_48_18]OGH83399.1 MAG: hypothetical protein A3G08_01025 [Candidatus Magasanikbacteria bacterium RIFCSPLOWO2_12_FULL_47_9b]HAZ29005.1 hypothetical protein [Candidatus Magasanikbacteria bacterium]